MIGYNINQDSAFFLDLPPYANHRFSALPKVENIACQNIAIGSRWTNLIYQVGESKDVVQLSRTECYKTSVNDSVLGIASSTLLTTCPCTRAQAARDGAYTYVDMNSVTQDADYTFYNCYIGSFRSDEYLSICCYG